MMNPLISIPSVTISCVGNLKLLVMTVAGHLGVRIWVVALIRNIWCCISIIILVSSILSKPTASKYYYVSHFIGNMNFHYLSFYLIYFCVEKLIIKYYNDTLYEIQIKNKIFINKFRWCLVLNYWNTSHKLYSMYILIQ